jgi:hypothetical protein
MDQTGKYIIEYVGGSKGDLLCRFLNNEISKIETTRSNKTNSSDIGCFNWLKLGCPYQLTLDRFEEVLATNTKKYVPAHPLWVTYDDRYLKLLEQYDYKILQLRFEESQYVTIRIESNLKNVDGEKHPEILVEFMNTVWWQGLDFNTFTSKQLTTIKPPKLESGDAWKQRAYVYDLFLSNTKNREFIFYSDLFLDFSCDTIKNYDLEEWKSLVDKSWCSAGGGSILGYRDWDKPRPSEKPKSKYSDIIEGYIDGRN